MPLVNHGTEVLSLAKLGVIKFLALLLLSLIGLMYI